MPEVLIRACANAGLPLFKGWTPFLTITRTFWSLLAREQRAPLDAALDSHRLLARAATARDPVTGVVRVLAEAYGGWAVRLDADGRPAERWPRAQPLADAVLAAECGRLRAAGPHSASTFPVEDDQVILQPLSRSGRLIGFVAVGSAHASRSESRALLLSGSVILTSVLSDASVDVLALRHRRASVCELVLLGEWKAGRLLASQSMGSALPQRAALACLVPGPGRSAGETLGRLGEVLGDGALWGAEYDGEVRCLVDPAQFGALDEAVEAIRSTIDPALSFAATDVVELQGIAERLPATSLAARRAASSTVDAAGSISRSVSGGPEGDRLVGLLSASGRAALVPTVSAWLRHRGSWEAASRELGTHRNTVRTRIALVERILDVDLEDPDVAARLWLSLRATGLA